MSLPPEVALHTMSVMDWLGMMGRSTVYGWALGLALAGVLLGLGLLLGWRWRSLWLIPVGLLMAPLGLLWGWSYSLSTTPTVRAPEAALRLAHLNMFAPNVADPAQRLAFVAHSDADVVSLVEVLPQWRDSLNQWAETFPHQAPAETKGGMVLLARWPVTPVQKWTHRAQLYHVARPAAPFYVLQVHPAAPFVPRALAERNRLLARLKPELLPRPLLVVGDFNTVPWDIALPDFAAQGFKLAGDWRGTLPTFPSFAPFTPIDLIYHDASFTVPRLAHVRVKGSDHLGLIADFPAKL